jgi:hypothetical protein
VGNVTRTLALTEFLLARIAEDEADVLDRWDSDGRARVATVWTGGDPGYTTVASDDGDGVWIADGREVTDARNAHVLFDPARVLAECEAKRQIVEWHRWSPSPGMECAGHPEPFAPHGDYGEGYCMYFAEHDGEFSPELRAIAAVYSDHPDYRDDWA